MLRHRYNISKYTTDNLSIWALQFDLDLRNNISRNNLMNGFRHKVCRISAARELFLKRNPKN